MPSSESRRSHPVYLRRLRYGLCVSLVFACAASAEMQADIENVEDCRALASDAQRLICYDTLVDGGVFTRQQAEKARVERFGSTDKPPEVVKDDIEQLAVTVVRVRKSDTGIRYFYTEDEQVWKQSGRGNWSLKAPFEARIKAGLMGSYFLVTDGGKSMRVKRVR